jgi:glutamate 5-kinase
MVSRQRIVIKVGTSTLTAGSKKLNSAQMVDLVRQASALHAKKIQVVLVTSGAMAAGREELGQPSLPKGVPAKQMLAAVGQPRLMAMDQQFFESYKVHVAQLLTRADLADRHGYLNARATFDALLEQGILPIVNENDTIATDEIRIGDNDYLSAQVANLIEADLLIMLTDQDGLYTSDPRVDKNAHLIETVGPETFSESLWQAAGGSENGLGTGGMVPKLQAADLARHGGTSVVIARGSLENVILRLAQGDSIGTRLQPMVNKLESRKRRILSGSHTKNIIIIDDGAARALQKGGSLLPAGIREIKGNFERGDTVKVVNQDAQAVAVGLTLYGSTDLHKLSGKKSAEIEPTLGYSFGEEAIHRDHMVLL